MCRRVCLELGGGKKVDAGWRVSARGWWKMLNKSQPFVRCINGNVIYVWVRSWGLMQRPAKECSEQRISPRVRESKDVAPSTSNANLEATWKSNVTGRGNKQINISIRLEGRRRWMSEANSPIKRGQGSRPQAESRLARAACRSVNY